MSSVLVLTHVSTSSSLHSPFSKRVAKTVRSGVVSEVIETLLKPNRH